MQYTGSHPQGGGEFLAIQMCAALKSTMFLSYIFWSKIVTGILPVWSEIGCKV